MTFVKQTIRKQIIEMQKIALANGKKYLTTQ